MLHASTSERSQQSQGINHRHNTCFFQKQALKRAPEHVPHHARHAERGVLAEEGGAVLVQRDARVALERAAAG